MTATRIADLTGDNQFAVLAAPGKYLGAHQDAVGRLTQAYREAITYVQGNRDQSVALAVSALKMKKEVAERSFDELAKDFTADGTINQAGLKAYADQLPALKLAKQPPAESDYYQAVR